MQTALAAVHCAVIQVGTAVSTIMLRSAGYPDPERDWPLLPVLIREWGPLAFAIPGAWVIGTIVLEQRSDWFSKRSTFFSGVALAGLLVLLYYLAAAGLPNPWAATH